MKDKVDFIISYVNRNDPVWEENAERCQVFNKNGGVSSHLRYNDDGLVELAVKSMKKYCNWVGNVYLILFDSPGQIPNNIKDLVTPIWHSEFIPEEYRPCFCSPTIEDFFPFLPDYVSNKFIYMNDDMILLKKMRYEQFFEGEYPKRSIEFVEGVGKHQNRILLNSYNLIMGKNQSIDSIISLHGPTPFNKKQLSECWEKHGGDILKTVNPLFRTEHSVSQYVYSVFDAIFYHTSTISVKNISLLNNRSYEGFDWDEINKYDSICMNTPPYGDISEYVDIVRKYIENN